MADDTTVEDEPVEAPPEPETAYEVLCADSLGQLVLHPTRDEYPSLLQRLHDDGFVLLIDLCGVDYLGASGRVLPVGIEPQRFEVVVQLYDPIGRRRLRLRVQVPEDDASVATAYGLFPGADAPEREAFDMFGIAFEGHPDPTRILMPEDWVGHPLRKDYAQGRIPVQFKSATNVR